MNDILTLTELIEDLTGGEITCIPVHGDIPIDDLMDAFETGLGKKVSKILGRYYYYTTLPRSNNTIKIIR